MVRIPVPLEAEEHKIVVGYLRLMGHKFHHSPNETGHTMDARRRAVRMKQQGTSPGFPDFIIIVNNKMIGVELKRRSGSVTSPEQLEWVKALNEANIPTIIAKGAAEAIEHVKKFE